MEFHFDETSDQLQVEGGGEMVAGVTSPDRYRSMIRNRPASAATAIMPDVAFFTLTLASAMAEKMASAGGLFMS